MKRSGIKPGAKAVERGSTFSAARPNHRGDATRLGAKRCAVCRDVFQPTIGYQKYCTPACRDRAEMVDAVCPWCSEAFEKRRSSRVRFCSKRCANRANWAKRRGTRELAPKRWWGLGLKGETACRNCGKPASHLHHIVPKSKSKAGALDVEGNGLPLCSECHRGWHDRVVIIGQHRLSDDEFTSATRIAGSEWLRRNYPDPPLSELLTIYFAKTGTWLEHGTGTAEPARRRTLRLLGVESVPEAELTTAWWVA